MNVFILAGKDHAILFTVLASTLICKVDRIRESEIQQKALIGNK